jgi:hypothetical protein
MNGNEIKTKLIQQTFNNKNTNGIDVLVWLFRHALYFPVFATLIVAVLGVIWKVYLEGKVNETAKAHDKPIIIRLDTLDSKVKRVKNTNADIYYTVKTMERIQKRTAPKSIVKEAEEETQIEKRRDKMKED